jgi:hypothetical protein
MGCLLNLFTQTVCCLVPRCVQNSEGCALRRGRGYNVAQDAIAHSDSSVTVISMCCNGDEVACTEQKTG